MNMRELLDELKRLRNEVTPDSGGPIPWAMKNRLAYEARKEKFYNAAPVLIEALETAIEGLKHAHEMKGMPNGITYESIVLAKLDALAREVEK